MRGREPRQQRYRGRPMTLADTRSQGVRSLWVVCDLCHHEAVLNVECLAEDVPVAWTRAGSHPICSWLHRH
jgi:hypothetical protein